MAKRKAKNETRMLAAVVPLEVASDFERVAKAHDRTVAAELRRLVREHIEAHDEGEREAA